MKKSMLALSILFYTLSTAAQTDYMAETKAWQSKMNAEFADSEESPLDEKDRAHFKKLKFYPISEKFVVTASFRLTPDAKPFKMPTSTDRLPEYVKYGIATFTIGTDTLELSIYQNVELSKQEEYKDYLFAPYKDRTNGNGSYGGGRYMDVEKPEGETIVLNFNKSYNPYCAYSDRYSCPIPPRENFLNTKIKAGVKAWKKH
ncbi:MAG: DUF1684 domain-containing protein [Cyclobacteriaceae bacterium]